MRQRLDVLVVDRGLAPSRAKAQGLIRAGAVSVDGQVMDKPGMAVPDTVTIAIRAGPDYVSRGGLKLRAALTGFAVQPKDRVCLDVGSATGGFTDALLQHGAHHVYAVDVGRGQLAWTLRQDPRVTCLERTDVRSLKTLPLEPTLATVDVAFISLRLVLPPTGSLLGPGSELIALVKPQFEAGRQAVGRGGIVRDPATHRQVLTAILGWARAAGWRLGGAMSSPITGAGGNREFLIHLGQEGSHVADRSVDALIDAAMTGDDGGA